MVSLISGCNWTSRVSLGDTIQRAMSTSTCAATLCIPVRHVRGCPTNLFPRHAGELRRAETHWFQRISRTWPLKWWGKKEVSTKEKMVKASNHAAMSSILRRWRLADTVNRRWPFNKSWGSCSDQSRLAASNSERATYLPCYDLFLHCKRLICKKKQCFATGNTLASSSSKDCSPWGWWGVLWC